MVSQLQQQQQERSPSPPLPPPPPLPPQRTSSRNAQFLSRHQLPAAVAESATTEISPPIPPPPPLLREEMPQSPTTSEYGRMFENMVTATVTTGNFSDLESIFSWNDEITSVKAAMTTTATTEIIDNNWENRESMKIFTDMPEASEAVATSTTNVTKDNFIQRNNENCASRVIHGSNPNVDDNNVVDNNNKMKSRIRRTRENSTNLTKENIKTKNDNCCFSEFNDTQVKFDNNRLYQPIVESTFSQQEKIRDEDPNKGTDLCTT